MNMSNKLYDILVTVGDTVLPALATLVISIGKTVKPGSEAGTIAAGVIMALDVFLNTILNKSSKNYYRDKAFDSTELNRHEAE